MNVKSITKALITPRLNVAAVVLGACAIFFLAAFANRKSGEVTSKRVNIAMRAIGHQLLLQAGDFSSLIPPVIEKSNGVFQLQFENEFVFQPDTLVAIVQRVLQKTGLSSYTVTVQRCFSTAIVYGFEINPPMNNIEACRGRTQPKACYKIEIAFADFPGSEITYSPYVMMISGVLSMVAFVLIGRSLWPRKSKPTQDQNLPIQEVSDRDSNVGKFVFDTTQQNLRIGDEIISLTDKECSILKLLNRNFGQLTLRDDLIQEVWTDEGVITGRSLDMFISKLRKKLSSDLELRITNVHGKGYKLEIVNDLQVS